MITFAWLFFLYRQVVIETGLEEKPYLGGGRDPRHVHSLQYYSPIYLSTHPPITDTTQPMTR